MYYNLKCAKIEIKLNWIELFFQEATKALVHSLDHLQGDLQNVEGLSEVKEILEAKKEVKLF